MSITAKKIALLRKIATLTETETKEVLQYATKLQKEQAKSQGGQNK